jgi:succinoglycan biosynthesis protein ExoM
MTRIPQISVCICTYQRARLLRRLISDIEAQETDGRFTYDIVIVDNDAAASGRSVVEEMAGRSRTPISYEIESEQNISLARNKAIARARGDFMAFIDDDEIPRSDWLLRLFSTLVDCRADGVLGPVRPRFESPPPRWAVRSAVFERPECATGVRLHWKSTRTGNVLIRRRALEAVDGPFRPEFGGGGEDVDFFQRAMRAGFVFVACKEAAVDELIPAERMRLSFQLRKALLRGKASAALRSDGEQLSVLKSLVACVAYTLLLPVLPLAGRHVFVKCLISDCDHLGKLLAVCGVDVVGQKYIVR